MRKIAFSIFNSLFNRALALDIKEIEKTNKNYQNSKSQQAKKLVQMLEYAQAKVPFYKDQSSLSLESFPVLDKLTYRSRLEEFLSVEFDKSKLHKTVTSGSTGTPFVSYQDDRKKRRNYADTIVFGGMAGYKVGYKYYYFKIWNHLNSNSILKNWLFNIEPYDVTNIDTQSIEKLLKHLEKTKSQNVALLGYASAYDEIVRYLKSTNQTFKINNVKSIIAMSEAFDNNTRKSMSHYFGVDAVSRYSNVENGIIAQQVNQSTFFLVNWASYVVEILSISSNERVENGTIGRIVITDLFNSAMPFIRYDTGDFGTLEWSEKYKQLVLKSVEGRKMDQVFNTKGELVSSFTITNNMWFFQEILQYQFIQLGPNSYQFTLNVGEKFSREKELLSIFHKIFGSDATFIVKYTDKIPLLNSGKRRKVVNKYLENR